MNISTVIKEERRKLSLSQEDLAEKVYVSRQTISSWENDKTYPDINSLIFLSQLFGMTVDKLIKGDLEIMEKKLEKKDIKDMDRYGWLMAVGLGATVILFPLSWHFGFIPGIVMAVLVWFATMYFAYKVEKIKKQYDVQTYREIVAFTKGETLDEIAKIRESGKRGYQKFLLAVGGAVLALIVALVFWWILSQTTSAVFSKSIK